MTTRRHVLLLGAGVAAGLPLSAHAADELADAVAAYTGGAKLGEGKVKIDIAPLVENGNTVPITVEVDSPMTATAFVKSIAIFNERNPERDVARFTLGSRAGRARVATRIRLATSQKLVAVARLSDDSWWSQSVDVIVTLAGCVEG